MRGRGDFVADIAVRRQAGPTSRSSRSRLLVIAVSSAGATLQVADAVSGAAAYVRSLGEAEMNPLTTAIVGAGGVAGLFWFKALLIAGVLAVIALIPERFGLLVASVLAIAGAFGLYSNVQNLDQQFNPGYWLDLLRSAGG